MSAATARQGLRDEAIAASAFRHPPQYYHPERTLEWQACTPLAVAQAHGRSGKIPARLISAISRRSSLNSPAGLGQR